MLSSALLIACSSAQEGWIQATSQNTVAGYESFLNKYPNSDHASEARQRLQRLQDDGRAQARNADTARAYQNYLQDLPIAVDVAEARDTMAIAERKAAWNSVHSTGSTAAYQAFLEKYARGSDADQARARLAALNGYAVKLASVRSQQEADELRDRLERQYGDVLHDVVVIPPSGTQKLNRGRSAPMTEDEAKSACATLKKLHQTCEVVKTKNS
jgi:hypothetical protein